MLNKDDDFARLMERVRGGCPDAVEEMLNRYGAHVRLVVRRRLHQRLRTQFDSVDFQQDVWASFFAADPRRYDFRSPEALIHYLSEMALHKVVDVFRRRLVAEKRSLNREFSLDGDYHGKLAPEVAARHASPSQLAMERERWDRLVKDQPEHCVKILELLRQGHTHAEVAQKLCLSTKMVQRLLRELKGRGEQP